MNHRVVARYCARVSGVTRSTTPASYYTNKPSKSKIFHFSSSTESFYAGSVKEKVKGILMSEEESSGFTSIRCKNSCKMKL
jgi:hypothetical protein